MASNLATDVYVMANDAAPAFVRTLKRTNPPTGEPLACFELLSMFGPDHVYLVGTDTEVLTFAARLIQAVADRNILAQLDAETGAA